MRILLVEDDDAIAQDVERELRASGYVVERVRDGEEAWFRGDTEDYVAAVLDLGLPRMDGLSVLKRWRESGRRLPVLVLTARGSWSEKVEGIHAGADDYLAKPFRMEELLARLRSVIRQSAGHDYCASEAGRRRRSAPCTRVLTNSILARSRSGFGECWSAPSGLCVGKRIRRIAQPPPSLRLQSPGTGL